VGQFYAEECFQIEDLPTDAFGNECVGDEERHQDVEDPDGFLIE
jgi:hypothetical protein